MLSTVLAFSLGGILQAAAGVAAIVCVVMGARSYLAEQRVERGERVRHYVSEKGEHQKTRKDIREGRTENHEARQENREAHERMESLLESMQEPDEPDAPAFHIDLQEPIAIGRVSQTSDGPLEAIAVFAHVRVTNEGAKGAALDWRAWADLANGSTIPLRRFTSEDRRFPAAVQGEIKREDLVWERTARALERHETRFGWFLGVLPIEVGPLLSDEWILIVACRDYRKRPHGTGVRLQWGPSQGLRRRSLKAADADLASVRAEEPVAP